MARGKNVQTIAVDNLTEHPVHVDLFGGLPDPKLADLVSSMEKDGQVNPVLALPDGRVVDGWRRVVAAGELAWPRVDVVVLPDLRCQAAIRARMLRMELSKRQIHPLTDAWLFRALQAAETGNRSWASTVEGRRLVRRRLQARLGDPSEAKLDRFERVLRLPRAMRLAVAAGTLDMTRALRAYRLSRAQKEEIVGLFEEFSPKRAVDHYLEA